MTEPSPGREAAADPLQDLYRGFRASLAAWSDQQQTRVAQLYRAALEDAAAAREAQRERSLAREGELEGVRNQLRGAVRAARAADERAEEAEGRADRAEGLAESFGSHLAGAWAGLALLLLGDSLRSLLAEPPAWMGFVGLAAAAFCAGGAVRTFRKVLSV